MPYNSLSQLPKQVTDNLPKHGQEIYMKAYNDAYERFEDPDNIRGDDEQETAAQKVAWSAVKRKYKKEGDSWIEK